jgi:hypothetical protein
MNSKLGYALVFAAFLTACGGASTSGNDTAPATSDAGVTEEARTCASIRSYVIKTAAENGVNIVKIYNPKTILNEPKKVSCSGRALVGSGQEAIVYYRNYQDSDGDWLVEYSERRLD